MLISSKYYHLFGLKKFIVVGVHKETNVKSQFIAISRKSKKAIRVVSKKVNANDFDFKVYNESQYAHMQKLKY